MGHSDIHIIVSSQLDSNIHLDDDCGACTNDTFSLFRSPNSEFAPYQTKITQPATLYVRPITEDYSLILNLMGQNQVAVLNQPALKLFNHFTAPRPIASVEELFPAISPSSLHQHVRQLLNLNLLESETANKLIVSSKIINQTSIKPPQEILTAWIHVTNQCNLRCPYCYIHKTPDKMALEIGKQSVDAVIRSALIHNFKRIKLKFAGGEATLNFALVAKLQAYAEQQATVHQLDYESVVLSNGVVITDRMIDFLQAHHMKLMISLDGVGDIHDRQRPFINGRGSFAQVEKSLDKLIKRDFLPAISITISKRNLEGLPETVGYVLERGLPFSLNFYRENECSAGVTDLRYTNQQIIEAMLAAFAIIEKYLPRPSLLNALVDRANLEQAHTRTCGVGQNYMVIDQNGNVAKCHMEIEKPITTIYAENPLLLLNQDQTGIQNLHVEEKEGCQNCEWRYWCAGGCPLLTYRATGRYDVKSPNCNIYKAIFPEVLRLEGLRILKYYRTN